MPLPPSLLQFAEQHGCFTGCYGCQSNVQTFLDPNQPPVRLVVVSCQDCLARVGATSAILPPGVDSYALADLLTQHVRNRRGYTLSVAGYHTNGPGFWFSAVYWAGPRLFLLNGERSRNLGTDLDLLLLAFRHKVLAVPDPGMLQAAAFAVQDVFIDPAKPPLNVTTKQALFQSGAVASQPSKGWQRLTLAEYQPTPAGLPAKKSAAKPLKAGDRCPACGAEVRQRSLLNRTFVGCLC